MSPISKFSSKSLFGQNVTYSNMLTDSPAGAVLAPYATGGTVTFVDNHWVHTFTASGTFTPTRTLECDFLVIGGGGGGGNGQGGGGGAGGYRTSFGTSGGNSSAESKIFLGANPYPVLVGAGGGGGNDCSGQRHGFQGSSSSIGPIESLGGAGGASGSGTRLRIYSGFNIVNQEVIITSNEGYTYAAGSGGGATNVTGTPTLPSFGTPRQGFNGGPQTALGNADASYGGGGGGAGQVGGASGASRGGNGLSSSIDGTATVRAGGGGGYIGFNHASFENGGSGGGGRGGTKNNWPASDVGSTSGSVNTGSGGGAMWNCATASAGGSGIVIVRYPA